MKEGETIMDNYLTENIDTVIFDIGNVLIHLSLIHICLQKSKSGRIENGNGRFPLSCYGTDGGKGNYMGRYYKSVIAEIDSLQV